MTVEGIDFNALDIVAAVYLIFGLFRGLKRGLSGELARLAGMAFVLFAGWRVYGPLGEKVAEVTRLTDEQSLLAGFAITILAAGIAMILLRLVLKNILEFTFKGKLEKIGGMVAGFLRSFILIALIVIPLGLSPIPYLQRTVAEESLLGSNIIKYLVPLYQQVSEENPDLGLPGLPAPPAEPETEDEPEDELEDPESRLAPPPDGVLEYGSNGLAEFFVISNTATLQHSTTPFFRHSITPPLHS